MNQRGAGGSSAAGGATRRAGASAQPSALRQRFFGGLFGGSSRSPSPMAAQFRGGGDLPSISTAQASAAANGAPSSRVAAAAGADGGGGPQDAAAGRGASAAVATLARQHNGGSGEDGGNEGVSVGVAAGEGQDRWTTIQEPIRYDIDLGYRRDIRAEYDVDGDQIGRGGNGKVVVVTQRESGKQFACKIIPKVLDPKRHTERKCRNHLASLQREISVLQALRGSLSVVELHNVFEDEENVWIVMEWCKGGELRARISERFYSERTVASFLRGVLRTVAVMHNHHILHRDIKPGNFMLLNDSDRSPLKAIDFGLAMPFDPDGLPISTLGLEGTPWYMAPEVLNHSVTPASDLWSIGVMAAELLTGKMPFDDHKNPRNARLSAIWGSILSDELDMRGHAWNGISDDAKMFVASLLQRDPSKRPTAKEALRHPWLKGDVSDRSQGRQLQRSVVQRIQRFGQGGVLQRAVLQGIVQDLLTTPAGGNPCSVDGDGAACRGRVCDPASALLEPLYAAVGLQDQSIGIGDLADRLKTMGFKLEASEMARLLEQLDVGSTGSIGRAAFAASQLDWKALQNNDPEEWARVAGDAFRQLDEDDDGILSTEDIATAMARRMPADEARAVAQSLLDECKRARVLQAKNDAGDGMELASMDASGAEWQGMDLRDFITMLRVSSCDTLDIYEDGLGFDPSKRDSVDVLNEILQHSGGEQPLSPTEQPKLAPEGFFRFDHSKPRKPAAPQETAPKLAPPGFFRFDVKEGGGAQGDAAERQPSQKTMFRFDVVGRRRPREPEPAPSQRALAHEPRVHAGGHFDKRHRGSNLYLNEVTRLMTVNK